MPKIHSIGPVDIVIYFDEHGAAHFHAIGPGYEAKIAIEDCALESFKFSRARTNKLAFKRHVGFTPATRRIAA